MLTGKRYRRTARETLGLAPASQLVLAPGCWHTRGVSEFPAPAGPQRQQGPDEPCVLLKLGEIVLKGRNRQQFERILQGNIRAALKDTGIPVDMRQREGVILL